MSPAEWSRTTSVARLHSGHNHSDDDNDDADDAIIFHKWMSLFLFFFVSTYGYGVRSVMFLVCFVGAMFIMWKFCAHVNRWLKD